MIWELKDLDLIKAITRGEAKAVHKELPEGGTWRTIKGHHIYIKDGKVLAGALPGVTGKAKKATKAQLAEHQATIDAEGKKNGKAKATSGSPKKKTGSVAKKGAEKKTKAPAKPAAKPKAVKGKKTDDVPKKTASKAKPAAKPSTKQPAKPKGAGKSVSATGAKKGASEGVKTTTKKPKDIRSEAQKNRQLAYDVGDKVGGARKDEFIRSFKEKPTYKSLDELEKMSGAVAEKMVTKANLLPKLDPNAEYANGVDLPTTIVKKLIFDRIAQKPEPSNPQTRREYMNAMQKLHRHLAGIKDFEQMRNAIRELSEYARNTSTNHLERTASSIKYQNQQATGTNSWGGKVTPEEQAKAKKLAKEFEDRLASHFEMKRAFNFEALGDKLNNFFTDWDSRERTMQTVKKTAADGWEKYLGKRTAAPKKERGAENKKWERKAEAEDLRTGGKKVKMDKPEQLMKEFGLRGVEFGNWVNDSSGKYHLQRSAEALSDLADVAGIDPKDISLNGRLAIAFGARGKGGALAHYEPDRKVINMTKYGGAGSLAHEWGHAMDNILQQYSEGGRESLGHASEGEMGDHDPKLKALYANVINAIKNPVPGDKGASAQIMLDSEAKEMKNYYPEMRRQVEGGMSPEDVFNHWTSKIHAKYNKIAENVKNPNRYGYKPETVAKDLKKYEGQRKREISNIAHYLAHELRRKQNGGKYGGEHYKGHIEMPTGNSEFYQRMIDTQPGKTQNGSHYWSQEPEMFARVFESWVQDKLDKAKRYNNYLVHGTREGNVKAEGAPFPLGKERQNMFKAMDNLMSYITKQKALKKALMMEILASGHGDMTEELEKSAMTKMLTSLWEETLGKDLERLHELGVDVSNLRPGGTGIPTKRSAYNVENPEEVIYIPINRLRTIYQTEEATNWDKVEENKKRMEAGENLDPVSIGFDYDVHDGHHRIEASKKCGYEHIPCIVKGGNEIERQNAIDAYREVWKSIVTDPVAPESAPFRFDEGYMFRGMGQKELNFILERGYIQSKGKGNDDDKEGGETCFSNLYSQAAGYARSNYDLYNEPQAYVVALPKPDNIDEDEFGELIARGKVPFDGAMIIPIPKELEQP